MINELHQLSLAIQNANIETKTWHREYQEIPQKTPCIRIVLDKSSVLFIENISSEKKANIRKFGSKQGTFPAMNLTNLFQVAEEDQRKKLNQIKRNIANFADISEIKKLCVNNNWKSDKFKRKYKICFENIPYELQNFLKKTDFYPLNQLIDITHNFINPEILHTALCERAFTMIEEKKDIELALNLLFSTKSGNTPENLSIILDTIELENQGLSTIGLNFTNGLNQALLFAEDEKQRAKEKTEMDAFGEFYAPVDEPMPEIKLAAGFTVSLRTMYKGQPSQFRYGKIGNDTYPISIKKRNEIKNALEFISSKEMKNKTWITISRNLKDKKDGKPDEVLLIYPDHFSDDIPGYIGMFASTYNDETRKLDFEAEAENFAQYITKTKEYDHEEYPDNIQLFVIKKLDIDSPSTRGKVIYSRNTTPDEIISQSEIWQKATKNIPYFYNGIFRIPFPIEVAEIMNRIWKQNGELSSDKFKSVKSYHGIELLFGLTKNDISYDLQILLRNSQKLAVYAGRYFNTKNHPDDKKIKNKVKSTIVLMGMLLFWLDQRKEEYMNEYPYLLGQLLKVSDKLHELYCYKVRDGNIPPQLVGGSMYMSASEFPKQAISQLSQRIIPYLNWANTHRNEKIENTEGTESNHFEPTAGYYLNQYRKIADKLSVVMTETSRFNDIDKASLFIGYLASFPKSLKKYEMENESEEL